VQAAASAIGRQVEVLVTSTSREIDTAFVTLVQKRIDALLVSPDLFLDTRRAQILVLEDAIAGGLMSYGSSIADVSRQLGIYTGRILKGEKPADMPILRATKFDTQAIAAELEKATLNPGAVAQTIGNTDKAMASAVTKVEATYQVPFLAHATMEPMNCTVHVRKDSCEIWVGSQAMARGSKRRRRRPPACRWTRSRSTTI
jgi:Molybdopterin-binding domain of aldehyde dehydrogenase